MLRGKLYCHYKLRLNIFLRLSQGVPSAFLPILHSALMEFSLPLAQHIAAQGVEMYGRTDLRFVEGLYKVR